MYFNATRDSSANYYKYLKNVQFILIQTFLIYSNYFIKHRRMRENLVPTITKTITL